MSYLQHVKLVARESATIADSFGSAASSTHPS
jgi:hypothetical protein